jgi:hypothetical protein
VGVWGHPLRLNIPRSAQLCATLDTFSFSWKLHLASFKRTVPPTPYVRHSTDCTCCDFGHLRFYKFVMLYGLYLQSLESLWIYWCDNLQTLILLVVEAGNAPGRLIRGNHGKPGSASLHLFYQIRDAKLIVICMSTSAKYSSCLDTMHCPEYLIIKCDINMFSQ